MTVLLSEDQTIIAVARLTRSGLQAFVSAGVMVPTASPEGPVFRPVDLARLELLCDLAEHFDLEGDALGVVMSLIDQLHTARQRLHAIAGALEPESLEIRHRVGARIIAVGHPAA
jgi:chaperone modulatory protein CbpM